MLRKIPERSGIAVLAAVVLLGFCLKYWLLRLPDIEWGIALSGWSPIDWVAHLNFPENFVHDFSNGIHVYGKSSFMHIYPLAYKWLGVQPESLIPVVIIFEILFLALSAAYLCRTIAPKADTAAPFIFGILVTFGWARSMEFTNFGGVFYWGLYYNIADGLRLLGIAFFLKRRIATSALLLAVSMTIHPVMALMGALLVFGCLLAEPDIVPPRRLAVAMLLFFAIFGTWLAFQFRDANITSGAIDPQVWTAMARALSFHFFPVDNGVLTTEHNKYLLPLLTLLALAAAYLPAVGEGGKRARAILCGLLVVAMLTAAGLLISVYVPNPALLKLALPRASDVLILVALAIAVPGLVRDVTSQSIIRQSLAVAILLSPLIMKPGFPALPSLALALMAVRDKGREEGQDLARHTTLALCLGIAGMAVAFRLTGILRPEHFPAYGGTTEFWAIAGGAALLALAFRMVSRYRRDDSISGSLALIALLTAFGYFGNIWIDRTPPSSTERKRGKDYLEAQLWAKDHTPTTSVFMVDPTIYYGWRDFSQRSSFGNLREWLHTSWLYDSRYGQYMEGKKRFDELGIDISPYLKYDPPINGFSGLHRAVWSRFYSMKSDWFVGMSRRYRIDYLVLSKNAIRMQYPFQLAFQNDSFIIYQLPGQSISAVLPSTPAKSSNPP